MIIEANRGCVVVTGTAAEIMDGLFGPQQHAEHCKGWRWHLYIRDCDRRMDNVRAEMRKMSAARRAAEAVPGAA